MIGFGRLLALLPFFLTAHAGAAGDVWQTERHAVRAVTVAGGLEHPWGMAFLPDGRILVTERPGRLRVVADGVLDARPVEGVPPVADYGQGGLLDVALHPDFADSRRVYLSYAGGGAGGIGTEVAHGRLVNHRLEDLTVIFRALPKSGGGRHFGSRLLFLPDGTLLITLGDRGEQAKAQDLGQHPGSIIRVRDDGTVPPDNPFTAMSGARDEIYTWGNRNVQGIALDPANGWVWATEHGPQGGDEVNRIEPGSNYGWPTITYGRNYGTGTKIGEGTQKAGMAQPALQWTPSIAPSGLAVYSGDRFPAWRGNLLAGALKFQLVARLELEGDRVVHEERILEGALGRIRDVRQGPDGYVYLLTDENDGRLVRLEPAD